MPPTCLSGRARPHFLDSSVPEGRAFRLFRARKGSIARYAYQAAASISEGLPVLIRHHRGDDIPYNAHRASHGPDPFPASSGRSRRQNVSHGFAESRDSQWRLRLADLLQQCQTLCLKFGNRHFLHDAPLRLQKSYHSQNKWSNLDSTV